MELVDRVAIVTGAARGIGRAIAVALAREGARVVVNDIDAESAAETVAEIVGKYGRGVAEPAIGDVSSGEEVQAIVDRVLSLVGRIDILVNNAGISLKKNGRKIPLEEITGEEWDRVLGTNLKGCFNFAKSVIPAMKRARFGRIVSISSTAGKTGNGGPAGAHYSASKAGIISLTRSMARELAPWGITANAIAPGIIQTDIARATDPKLNEILLKQIPLGRFGSPEEVAELVIFLVSSRASYITGETIDLNGGWLID
ncbi:MAG: SDR family NAD(P)-dependent oxidoreductase [Bacillota bacterium]